MTASREWPAVEAEIRARVAALFHDVDPTAPIGARRGASTADARLLIADIRTLLARLDEVTAQLHTQVEQVKWWNAKAVEAGAERDALRGAAHADHERLEAAAAKAGLPYASCDTPDDLADKVVGLRAEAAALRAELEKVRSAQESLCVGPIQVTWKPGARAPSQPSAESLISAFEKAMEVGHGTTFNAARNALLARMTP